MISKVTLKLPALTDPADITVINTALKQLETTINLVVTDVNKALKEISSTDDYVEVEK